MPTDTFAEKIAEVTSSGSINDIQSLLRSIEDAARSYSEDSNERRNLDAYIVNLRKVLQERQKMSDYIQQAKEGVAKRDWGFVIFCLTRHFNLPDPQGTGFDAAVEIIEKLLEPKVLEDAGQDRVLDFLKKIPVQYQTNPKYLQFLNQIKNEESASSPGDADAMRKKIHDGKSDLIALVDEGLAFMYSYAFDKAIAKFQQVLTIDPDYESAKEYLQEAREYKSGKTRPPRLTQEVTLPLGRAMSMIRAGQFKLAQSELTSVYATLERRGIEEWEELNELFKEVTDGANAETLFFEAKEIFKKGDLDSATEKTRQAFDLLKRPQYQEYIQKIDAFKSEVNSLQISISSTGNVDDQINLLLEAEDKLKRLIINHPENELLFKLKKDIDSKKPIIKNGLIRRAENILDKIDEDRYSSELSSAVSQIKKAAQALESAENAGALGQEFDQVRANVQSKLTQLEGLNRNLVEAENLIIDDSTWAWLRWQNAASRIAPVARQYPRDTRVQKIKADLKIRDNVLLMGKIAGSFIILFLLVLCLYTIYSSTRSAILALTPSPTPAPPTETFTPLPLPTDTPTATPFPPTSTPLPTSTPVYYLVPKDVYTRVGCYESFTASGRILAGSRVYPDWNSETKDPFNRTCLFVRYQQDNGETISGYVLLSDLELP